MLKIIGPYNAAEKGAESESNKKEGNAALPTTVAEFEARVRQIMAAAPAPKTEPELGHPWQQVKKLWTTMSEDLRKKMKWYGVRQIPLTKEELSKTMEELEALVLEKRSSMSGSFISLDVWVRAWTDDERKNGIIGDEIGLDIRMLDSKEDEKTIKEKLAKLTN